MRYQFSIDRGGTFTDCILFDRATQSRTVTKVLSGPDSPLIGIRQLLGLDPGAPIPPSDVRLGTTLATNALLERKGARAGLLITRGFRDLLEIGTQARRHLFELDIRKVEQLYQAVEEIDARLGPDGRIRQEPHRTDVEKCLRSFEERGISSVALVVLHAYANPAFEEQLKSWALPFGFDSVVTSTEAANELGFLARSQTCVLDAYLLPMLRDYSSRLQAELPGSRIRMMQSAGGLAAPELLRGPAALLSGPAGGAIAATRLARELGAERVMTFDMGGTSTDVALVSSEPEMRYESELSGVQILAPMIDIHTVAAGGGSICRFDGDTFTVGPQSAGAVPGPLIYGSPEARELTISDVNYLLGRLTPDHFPFPLKPARAEAALTAIHGQLQNAGFAKTPDEILLGFCEVAVTHMAEAITKVTIRRGEDPRRTTLLAFGGAGGQHACDVARRLGIREVAIHRLAGVLSAYGIGLADTLGRAEQDAGRRPLDPATLDALESSIAQLSQAAIDQLGQDRSVPSRTLTTWAELRYRGTTSGFLVPWGTAEAMRRHFEGDHLRRFSFHKPEAVVEIVSIHVEARVPGEALCPPTSQPLQAGSRRPPRSISCVDYDGQRKRIPVLEMGDLPREAIVLGPALILDPTGTVFLPGDFSARLQGDVLRILQRDDAQATPHKARPTSAVDRSAPDPILLEIMSARLSAVAEQMGEALRATAVSTNIRDRLDFSCAVFDGHGRLIANAPHIPVHLGAMGESVRAVLERHPGMLPGDAFVTNDPRLGGSHLPDITVVAPVFSPEAKESPSYFVASRGHHADIGGITPGSMPAFSRTLAEEGVVFSAVPLISEGRFLEEEVRGALSAGPYPARNPEENVADLKAQIAALTLGSRLLLRLEQERGRNVVQSYMLHLVQLAERKTRRAIATLPPGASFFCDELDDGSQISVELKLHPPEDADTEVLLSIDFSGSGPESSGNFNAPRAVTVAAVLYFLRTLVNEDLPLNDGCLRPVRIITRKPSLIDPSPHCAVAAGNVETSMRLCDVLFAAAGLCAASQGTMNNISFGDSSFGYYETVAGGAGAGPTFSGASSVHTHMTNTRITDIEVLETRFPVIVHEFARRRGSGGGGRNSGGDGVVRTFEFTAPVQLTLLSGRRDRGAFGLCGGTAGLPGRNLLDGQPLPACTSRELKAGQVLTIETPGGGGFGPATPRQPGR